MNPLTIIKLFLASVLIGLVAVVVGFIFYFTAKIFVYELTRKEPPAKVYPTDCLTPGVPQLGDSKQQVVKCSWGSFNRADQSITENGYYETWYWNKAPGRRLVFKDDILTVIENRKQNDN